MSSVLLSLWSFAPNEGQLADPDVLYVARGSGSVALVTSDGAAFPVGDRVVRMRFDEGRPDRWEEQERGTPVTFAHGRNAAPVSVPSYARIEANDMWQGVDVVWHGDQGALEYDLVVQPGADLAHAGVWFEGADDVVIDSEGDLVVTAGAATLRQRRPVAWQADHTPVPAHWVVDAQGRATFALGAHDPNQVVTIDPVILYEVQWTDANTAEQGNEETLDVALDTKLNAYVTGYTTSTDFPTTGGAAHQGLYDAFVVKLDPDGNIVWSMFLGGTEDEQGRGIAVDGKGSAIVMGRTNSSDFPTRNALQPNLSGGSDAFVTRITPNGDKFVYSTYLGGSSWEIGDDGAVLFRLFNGDVDADEQGNAYVTGDSMSLDFPVSANAFQGTNGGGACAPDPACEDAFAVKLDPNGQLTWGTYLGGKSSDRGNGITVDRATREVVVYGEAGGNFPTTPGAFQPQGGIVDLFVSKLAPDGASLAWSTFLGGTGTEFPASEVAIGRDSSVYVTGQTASFDFPTTPGVLEENKVGDLDAVVARFDAAGGLLWSTHVGGLDDEAGYGIDVDKKGRVVITGFTTSGGTYPEVDEFTPCSAAEMLTVTELNPSGSKVRFSSCVPSSGWKGNGLAILGDTQVIAGSTKAGPGAQDATVLRIDDSLPGDADLAVSQVATPDVVLNEFDDITYVVTVENLGPDPALDARLDDSFPDAVTLRTLTTTQGTCGSTSADVFCDFGEIAPGDTVTVEFVVSVSCTTPQPMFNTAEVSSGTNDPNGANDVSEETTGLDPNAC